MYFVQQDCTEKVKGEFESSCKPPYSLGNVCFDVASWFVSDNKLLA